jgi:FkbM family methyltransferase
VTPLKKFYPFDEDKPFYFREETTDVDLINEVFVNKGGYLLPNMKPKIVFDIGANVGVVSVLLANIYPEAKIFAFEPVPSNFEILLKNAHPYPNINPVEYALSDHSGWANIHVSDDPRNEGGYSVAIACDREEPIRVGLLDTQEAFSNFGVPELIKIDCEGAEHSILGYLDRDQLEQIKWIAGELHGVNDWELLAKLNPLFDLMVQKGLDQRCFHFHARNKNWTPNQS